MNIHGCATSRFCFDIKASLLLLLLHLINIKSTEPCGLFGLV